MKQPPSKCVLGIFAHPDDAEFLCAGTLTLLQQAGWQVHIATLAPAILLLGNAGHGKCPVALHTAQIRL